MRTRSATFLTATVALLMLSATALTQQPRPGFGGAMARGGALMILQSEDVQKELKLTDEQKGKVAEVAKTYRGKIMELINLPEGERAVKANELAKAAADDAKKFKTEVLKPDQARRLRQIELQTGGLAALGADEDLQKELKLSDEQKIKLKALFEEQQKELQELAAGAFGNPKAAKETQEKIATLRKENLEKAVALLNDEQKKAWTEMQGPKFEGQVRPPLKKG